MAHIYNQSISDYLNQIGKFLSERLDLGRDDITSVVKFKYVETNAKEIDSVLIKIEDKKFISCDYIEYTVKINEILFPIEDTDCKSFKFSYELRGIPNEEDLIRFDFNDNYTKYPKYHINANEKTWGKYHLVFPEDTNIDLKKMNAVIALNMFQKHVCHPDNHILDKENNNDYLAMLI
ncbi:MAG: hypothetical protein RR554_04045 [Vagococcus sp.]|uniref:hypothetical protein n=1 Tax=Vagococcus sp. TaxID=1933889 RepID=UPI002FC81562